MRDGLKSELTERPMIFTDLETSTGWQNKLRNDFPGCERLYPYCEIIEIGAVKAHPRTLKILGKFSLKTKMKYPFRMEPAARKVNGYREDRWADAPDLWEGLRRYNQFAAGGVFWSDTPSFDFTLLEIAWTVFQMKHPVQRKPCSVQDYVNGMLQAKGYKEFDRSFTDQAKYLGVTEPKVHRAINGAMKAYRTYVAALKLPYLPPLHSPAEDPAGGC